MDGKSRARSSERRRSHLLVETFSQKNKNRNWKSKKKEVTDRGAVSPVLASAPAPRFGSLPSIAGGRGGGFCSRDIPKAPVGRSRPQPLCPGVTLPGEDRAPAVGVEEAGNGIRGNDDSHVRSRREYSSARVTECVLGRRRERETRRLRPPRSHKANGCEWCGSPCY